MSGYDPTDVRQQQLDKREDEARKRAQRQTEIGDLKWLMSSPRGRRFVWRLLSISGPFRMSFDTNALKMAFAEGSRSVGNSLLNEVMNLCPELYPVMMKEQHDDRDGDGDHTN